MTSYNYTRVTDNVDDVLASQHNELIDGLQNFPLPQGFAENYRLSVTVASNNLTVALKTLAGNDPSSTDFVSVRIGNTTRTVTAALSVTKNAATNWCNSGSAELATNEIDYFAYLGYNATDGVVIGFSRIPYANLYSDFSATSTNEKYAGISTITNAAAGDDYVVIGRFAATLSAGAGYTWTVPTFTSANLIQRPIFETRQLAWTPTHTRVTTNYTNLPVTNNAEYQMVGRNLLAQEQHTQNATPGGSGQQSVSLPFTITISSRIGSGINLSTAVSLVVYGASAGSVITLFRYDATTECTASNVYLFNVIYRIG